MATSDAAVIMDVVPVPVLEDNYAYLLIDRTQKLCAAIDPADASTVYAKATEIGVTIDKILTTHKHWDHAGGNKALVDLIATKEQRTIEVVGGRHDGIEAVTTMVDDQDVVQIGSLSVGVLATPGHTNGHVIFHCNDAAFTGDTLFIAGCGRLFEGTPAEMNTSLQHLVTSLPATTRVFCGHEYTVSNLRFALHVEPNNERIQQKLAWAQAERAANRPTIPSTLADELATNPFLRVSAPDVQKFADGKTDPAEVFGVVRGAKDHF